MPRIVDRYGHRRFCAALIKPSCTSTASFSRAPAGRLQLPLTPSQIDLLIEAAKANWREVEPAIFGTLLERALDPTERHALVPTTRRAPM